MARRLTLALPGDINTLTGGYLYDKHVSKELAEQGWDVDILSLDAGFPFVDDAVKQATVQRLAAVAPDRDLVIDGLALGALGEHAQAIKLRRAFVALVHHPLALESGLTAHAAQKLHTSERVALSAASGVIVTSPTTCQTLIDQYGVAAHQIEVIEPGVDRPRVSPSALPHRSPPKPGVNDTNTPLKLLSVGAIVPRKGFDVLIQALSQLADLPWTLDIVGDDQRAAETVAQLKTLIAQYGLTDRVQLLGAQPREALNRHYQQADVFVLASHYEGYGMAYAEALAWGLPTIGTDGGASAQTLDTPAARVVPANDAPSLAMTLRELMNNPQKRADMRAAALKHANALPTWESVGERFARALNRMRTP
ncbi:MAG TPA: glycosyltransferase family 4 protein [Orrella sp.]